MTPAQLSAFIAEYFPHIMSQVKILNLVSKHAKLRHHIDTEQLRPGNTVSGPTLMTLADLALYAAILATDDKAIQAVTTNLTINFLHRPQPEHDIIAECQLIKFGRRLAVGNVSLYSDNNDATLVAYVTGTYALPPPSTSMTE